GSVVPSCFSSTPILPAALCTSMRPSATSAMPAESYPRYSRRLRPSNSRPAACRGPVYPTMPHMVGKNNTPGAAVARRGGRAEIVTTDVPVVDSPARARGTRHRGRGAHGAARGPGHARPGAGSRGRRGGRGARVGRSEEHTSELQSRENLVCRLLLEKKKAR